MFGAHYSGACGALQPTAGRAVACCPHALNATITNALPTIRYARLPMKLSLLRAERSVRQSNNEQWHRAYNR
jgi:hypothetical protein